jgi:hypothetical protein
MIHLVVLLSILGAEHRSSKPLPLSERQIVSVQKATFAAQRHDAAIKIQLADIQQELIGAYANYELDEERIVELQEEVVRLQRELLKNYHRLQLELRRATGPESYAVIKHRVDLYRKSQAQTGDPPPKEDAEPPKVAKPQS